MAGVSGQKDFVFHGVVGGHRLFHGKLGKPDDLLHAQTVGFDGSFDPAQRLLESEVVGVHPNIESVELAFSRNPGHIGRLVLEDDNLGCLRKIRLDDDVEHRPHNLRPYNGKRNFELVSNPRLGPVAPDHVLRFDHFVTRSHDSASRVQEFQTLDFGLPLDARFKFGELLVQQTLHIGLTQHQEVLVKTPL